MGLEQESLTILHEKKIILQKLPKVKLPKLVHSHIVKLEEQSSAESCAAGVH